MKLAGVIWDFMDFWCEVWSLTGMKSVFDFIIYLTLCLLGDQATSAIPSRSILLLPADYLHSMNTSFFFQDS
jgi:uncharacterized membrane protein